MTLTSRIHQIGFLFSCIDSEIQIAATHEQEKRTTRAEENLSRALEMEERLNTYIAETIEDYPVTCTNIKNNLPTYIVGDPDSYYQKGMALLVKYVK